MLPNESLLVVLHFADYKTLVLAKLSGRQFLRLIVKYAEELARRRTFRVTFYATRIEFEDVTVSGQRSFRYERFSLASLAAACRELAEVIGPHAVAELSSRENTWDVPGVGVVFEAAPPLKYAEAVVIHHYVHDFVCHDSLRQFRSAAGFTCEAFMSNFTGVKSLHLLIDWEVFRRFSWTFLRQASKLRRIAVSVMPSTLTKYAIHAVEDLVHYCGTLPHSRGGESLELDFTANDLSGAFGLRIIELLTDSGRDLTVRMRTVRNDELVLDKSEYTVDVEDTTTRYVSERTGIVVKVDGYQTTMQSTAEAPPTKRTRRNE